MNTAPSQAGAGAEPTPFATDEKEDRGLRNTAEPPPRASSPSDDPPVIFWQSLMWRVTNQTTPPDTQARGDWGIKPHIWRDTVTLDFAFCWRTEKSIIVRPNINLNEGHMKSSSQRGHSTNDDQQHGNTELSERLFFPWSHTLLSSLLGRLPLSKRQSL